MTSRRFFAILWRINAIVLLLVGLLAGAALTGMALLFYRDATQPRHADGMANLAVGDMASKMSLGNFEAVPKTSILRAPLRVIQSYAVGSVSKDASSIRNYLYYEPSTRTTRWLKPSMESLIVRTWIVSEKECAGAPDDWVSNVYTIVSKDTDGDSRLTESDHIQIASSDPDGKNYRILVDKADHVNDTRLLAEDRILILYSVDEKLHAVEFNPRLHQAAPQHYEVKLPVVAK